MHCVDSVEEHLAGERDDDADRDVELRVPEDVAQLLDGDRLIVLPAQRGDAHEVRFESFTGCAGRALNALDALHPLQALQPLDALQARDALFALLTWQPLRALRSLRTRSSGATAGAAIEDAVDDLGEHRRAREQAAAEAVVDTSDARREVSRGVGARVGIEHHEAGPVTRDRREHDAVRFVAVVAAVERLPQQFAAVVLLDLEHRDPTRFRRSERVRDVDRVGCDREVVCVTRETQRGADRIRQVGNDPRDTDHLQPARTAGRLECVHPRIAREVDARAGERIRTERIGGGRIDRPHAAVGSRNDEQRVPRLGQGRERARLHARHERADRGVGRSRQ